MPSVGVALRASCVWRAPSHAVVPLGRRRSRRAATSSFERSSRLVCGVVGAGAGGVTSVPSTLPVPAKL